eukprot:scaffold45716_cov53-Phaeocystis_antarctica.AAC.1
MISQPKTPFLGVVFDGDHDFEGPRSPKAHFDTVNASGNLQLDGEVVCQSVSLAGDPPRLSESPHHQIRKTKLGIAAPSDPDSDASRRSQRALPHREISLDHTSQSTTLSGSPDLMPAKPEPATSVPSPTSREIPRSDRNIYLTTEALAALPLRAQPPPPTEMPAKPEPMRSLLPREIS